MRELKFRFWCPYKKEMKDGLSLHDINGNYNLPAQVFDHAMQYIGLKDKSGKEIYEGDIVRFVSNSIETVTANMPPEYEVAKVVWDESDSAFKYCSWQPPRYQYKKTEIIGNIYENPELLEKVCEN